MFDLISRGYTKSALDHGNGTYMMVYNEGNNVGIFLDDKKVVVPVNEFYEKMKEMFFKKEDQ